MSKKTKSNIDSYLNLIFLILLITISFTSLFIIKDYLGYITHHLAKDGTITEINIQHREPATFWNGIYGLVIMFPAINNTYSVKATNAGMSQVTMLVQCLQPGVDHEVYAVNDPPNNINWENVDAATTEFYDNFTGAATGERMSAANTFTNTMEIELGERTITDIPMTYTHQRDNHDSTTFMHGLLTDGNHIIVVAKVTSGYPQGYDGNYYNYQMFVPVPNGTFEWYYLVTDPYDECPGAGDHEEEDIEEGTVYGWAYDNKTGIALENVRVFVGSSMAVTDTEGFYNLTTYAGDYKIFAIKKGYNNYINNVTVTANISTGHNISMIMYTEEQEGTGTGVGTGVGPGRTDKTEDETKTGEGPGVGPGIGPGIGPYLEEPLEPGVDHFVSIEKIYKKIRIGNFFTEQVVIYNFREESAEVTLEITGNASEIVQIDRNALTVDSDSFENITVTGFGKRLGTFTGELKFSGDFNDTIPIRIIVTDEDKLPVEALLMQLEILTDKPYAGDIFKFRLNLHNMLVEEQYNVSLNYSVRGIDALTSNYSMDLSVDNVRILTALSIIKEFQIPKDWSKGEYMLLIDAEYLELYSQSSTIFRVYEPFYKYKIFGILPLWQFLLGLFILALIILAIIIIRARIEAKKRFHAKVDYKALPDKGPRSIYVGKIAETEKDTYFDMDKLTVHSIVAGSTGGGKTIAGQDIIEECLMKDIAVIVFDPTAQWTGMLRKCRDKKMMSFYPRFHLKKKDARAFNGNVRAIKNAREKIKLGEYMKPGEIQIFTLSTLDPKEIDIFVANTVREIFHSNLQEYRGLRTMMVYDEVHRLLPKFGGSGEGFIQIERACREFRKWGIGVLLISQVLADFVGQIKANINTEVQMKTRDEGDLKRIETKYGKDYIQALVKAPVGSGMVQNSSWNNGKPYYVTFRPILHSVKRLSDDELAKYNKYNEIVDDLKYQLDQLEEEDQDVFDLRLELKLALDKIKAGNFNMVEIYLEGLKPRIEKIWKDIGKEPKRHKIELISEDEIKADLEDAKKEREEFEKTTEKKAEKTEKEPLNYDEDVPPDNILKLSNGMLVINLKSLYDEVKAMKESDYKKHVNEEQNDFSDWIRDAVGNSEMADAAEKILTKEDYLKFLETVEKGKWKEFEPETPRENIPEKKNDSTDKQKEMKEDEKDNSESNKKAEDEPESPEPEKNTMNKDKNTDQKDGPEQNIDEEKENKLKTSKDNESDYDNAKTEQDNPEEQDRESKNNTSGETSENKNQEDIPETETRQKNEHADNAADKSTDAKQGNQEKTENQKQNTESEKEPDLYNIKIPPENYFKLSDGRIIKNISELKDILRILDDNIFYSHVSGDKNDFANWIRAIYKSDSLGDKLAGAKSKQDMIEIIKHVLKNGK
ncbi:DUF87 domain-containing protein [Candidatus Woesearchaeota archaeon]|nr:DUF87 domain-containing protein [Candidatus Woesearchaeota archaeon]